MRRRVHLRHAHLRVKALSVARPPAPDTCSAVPVWSLRLPTGGPGGRAGPPARCARSPPHPYLRGTTGHAFPSGGRR
ncbi:Hypothetical protein AA314_09237 [Archangium gephyra]|uniref:Uncharacterized protein n=1 Tax=Archangium gephyra TaxID=48 RepID=A0AAC8QIF5_9BACT|nr:Hypothetical protein AA314_09237 [Archangium gephyra]